MNYYHDDLKVGDLVKLKYTDDVLGLVIKVGSNPERWWGEDEDKDLRCIRVLWQETNEVEYILGEELHKVSRGA